MSKTITGSNLTAQAGRVLVPRYSATVKDETLRFTAPALQSLTNLDTTCYQSIEQSSSSHAYAAYRSAGNPLSYLRTFDPATAAHWGFGAITTTGFGSSAVSCLRPQVFREAGGNTYLYTVVNSSNFAQVQRAQLTGTSNPVTVSLSNYNTTLFSFLDSATVVRRVETVLPTDSGVIVVVGEHSFPGKFTTLTFWYLASSSATPVQLNTMFQLPLTTAYASDWGSAWYGGAKYCSNCAAISIGTNSIAIVVETSPYGRPVIFTLVNGVESQPTPLVHTDIEQTSFFFKVASLTKINSVYYLCGRAIFANDGTTQAAFDVALTSTDGVNFSIIHGDSYLSQNECGGKLLMPSGSANVYYGGCGYFLSAKATPVQGGAGDTKVLNLKKWSGQLVTNAAATLSGEVSAETAIDAAFKEDAVVYLNAGYQGGAQDAYGVFGVDSLSSGLSVTDGRSGISFEARDIGSKRLNEYQIPFDGAVIGDTFLPLDLKIGTGLQTMTDNSAGDFAFRPDYSLRYDGLNNPLIAFFDAPQSDAAMFDVITTMGVNNAYHASYIGFLMGMDDKANGGHLFLIPKGNGLATLPLVQRMALPAIDATDPTKKDTGFNLARRMTSLISAWGGEANIRSAAANGTYLKQIGTLPTPNTKTEILFRRSGRRVQIFKKNVDWTTGGCAAASAFTCVLDFLFDANERLGTPGKIVRDGMVIGTESTANISTWWAGVGNDIDVSLTDAGNYEGFGRYIDAGSVSWGTPGTGDTSTIDFGHTPNAELTVGKWVNIIIPTLINTISKITVRGATSITVSPAWTIGSGGYSGNVYLQTDNEEWGYGSSGSKKMIVLKKGFAEDTIQINPGAKKTAEPIISRAMFWFSAGASIRYVKTNGSYHGLLTGSPGTGMGWDATCPIENTGTPDSQRYSGGSKPQDFGLLLRPGVLENLVNNSIAGKGYMIPTLDWTQQFLIAGLIDKDTEIVRYQQTAIKRRDNTTTTNLMEVPSYYCLAGRMSAGAFSVRNFRTSAACAFPNAQPGDDLGDIATAVANGLYVEVVSTNGLQDSDGEKYYATGSTKIGSPNENSTSSLSLNKAYPNQQHSIDPTSLAGLTDLIAATGRAQFGTDKIKHPRGTPVCYCPVASNTASEIANVVVHRADYFVNRIKTVEDVTRRVATMAGHHNNKFRNAFNSTYASTGYTFSIGTSPTSLPLYENVSNFTLDLTCHIPGSGRGSGNYDNRLNIEFRGYYGISIQQYNTAAEMAAGHFGNIAVGLYTTSNVINASATPFGTFRYFKTIVVPVTDYNISGSTTGSGANWTHTEDTAKNVVVRLHVRDNLVSVEIAGQPIVRFNLANLGDSSEFYTKAAGAITVQYNSAIGGNSAFASVSELGDAVGSFAFEAGAIGWAMMADAHSDRHIYLRSKQDGGLEYAQFRTRDTNANLAKHMKAHKWGIDSQKRVAHVRSVGEKAGDAIDYTAARTKGYRFRKSNNRLLKTSEQGTIEARLALRSMAEEAEPDTVSGPYMIENEPEDMVGLVYQPTAGNKVPTHALTQHVIKSINITADDKGMNADYEMRDYISTL